MPGVTPIRFGVVFTGLATATEFRELAKRVEAEGFSSLLVADHLSGRMACTPLIAAAAGATTTLRVGSYVYNNDFRHPVLLAKEVATLDVLSEGRVEFGIGAGYLTPEYESAGIRFDPPGVRLSRLEEAVGIVRRLLEGEVVDHAGEHYQLHGQQGTPLPVQRPVPLMIGGGGDRMIRLAAREAQIMAFVPRALRAGGLDPNDMTAEALTSRIERLKAEVAAAGRIDQQPERAILLMSVLRSVAEVPDDAFVSREVAMDSPYIVIGDESAIAEQLVETAERWGITYQVCYAREFERLLPAVRRLA